MEIHSLVVHKLLEDFATFVVESLELGPESMVDKKLMELPIGPEYFGWGSVFECVRQDGIGVVVIEDEDIPDGVCGHDGELSCLIGCDATGAFG